MDIRCVWCQVVCHDDCNKPITSCDLGKYQKWILPPTSITLKVRAVNREISNISLKTILCTKSMFLKYFYAMWLMAIN